LHFNLYWAPEHFSIVIEHDPKEGRLRLPIKAPFHQIRRGASEYRLVECDAYGKWVSDFNLGRQYAQKFWEVCGSGRTFALDFQQVILGMLTTAKTYKDASYSGIEAGFLLAVGYEP